MSTGNVQITPEDLKDAARRIRECRREIEDCLNETNSQMTGLFNNGWRSRAGRRLQERFNALRSRFFANYPEAMQQYADYLDRTAQNYIDAEARREAKIEGLGNMGQA